MKDFLKYSCCFVLILSSLTGHTITINSKALEKQALDSIEKLYHAVNAIPNTSMTERINWFSAQFKDHPYTLGALGEGANARFDQFPKFRVDAFDCDTFVNTVLALALANSTQTFELCLKHLRYNQGRIAYIHRNHFTSLDWNLNNQAIGVLKDITLQIKGQNNEPIALFAEALIDKPNWYAFKTNTTIRLLKENKEKQNQRLTELKYKGSKLPVIMSKIPYIPFKVLFDEHGNPNLKIFSQIPQSAIIEIIRPNWNLRQQIGTNLNVSHLGFAIWIKGTLFFRQASSEKKKIVDIPLIDYLKTAQKSPTIKGINIQIVLPAKPLEEKWKYELGHL